MVCHWIVRSLGLLFSRKVTSDSFCEPIDWSPPGSSVHGTSQARTLEWVAPSCSRGIFLTQGLDLCLLHWQVGFFTPEPPGATLAGPRGILRSRLETAGCSSPVRPAL